MNTVIVQYSTEKCTESVFSKCPCKRAASSSVRLWCHRYTVTSHITVTAVAAKQLAELMQKHGGRCLLRPVRADQWQQTSGSIRLNRGVAAMNPTWAWRQVKCYLLKNKDLKFSIYIHGRFSISCFKTKNNRHVVNMKVLQLLTQHFLYTFTLQSQLTA